MNFSTTPPYRPTMIRHRSKYADNSSRTSSESLDSDNGVKPTRSPNSTDVTRRSATGEASTGRPAGASPANGVPHSAQNLPPSHGLPQVEQARNATPTPHDGQNFAPRRIVAPQAEHSPFTCRIPRSWTQHTNPGWPRGFEPDATGWPRAASESCWSHRTWPQERPC